MKKRQQQRPPSRSRSLTAIAFWFFIRSRPFHYAMPLLRKPVQLQPRSALPGALQDWCECLSLTSSASAALPFATRFS